MNRSKTPISRYKKLAALLVAIFMLGNFLFLFPVYASSAPQQTLSAADQSSSFCIPIPIIFPCKSPTPTPTTPTCISIPIIHPCKSPTPTGTPTLTSTGTPTKPQLSVSGSFTLTATDIVAMNARLNISDVLHPVLSFASVSIDGMQLTHLSVTLRATGVVTGSGVAIKTSVFKDLVTALGSFTNKADLLLLLAGLTVKTLTMKHVTLQIDRYISMQSLTVNGLIVNS